MRSYDNWLCENDPAELEEEWELEEERREIEIDRAESMAGDEIEGEEP